MQLSSRLAATSRISIAVKHLSIEWIVLLDICDALVHVVNADSGFAGHIDPPLQIGRARQERHVALDLLR